MLFTYRVLSNGAQTCLFLLIRDRSMLPDKKVFKQDLSNQANQGIQADAA